MEWWRRWLVVGVVEKVVVVGVVEKMVVVGVVEKVVGGWRGGKGGCGC